MKNYTLLFISLIIITACGGGGGGSDGSGSGYSPPTNNPPSITNTNMSISVVENQTSAFTVNASDPDGDNLTYTISGDDANIFTISNQGVVTFNAEPDFENPKEVRDFLNILSDLLKNLGVADPSLEGAMRADANVSVHGGNKVEIKNIGSFHDLEKAAHFEITRQESLHDRDIPIVQETRHWDDRRKITVSSRSKEEDLDYRYFLEGDIPWVKINPEIQSELKSKMPESISSKKERYISKYNIPEQVADVLSSDKFYSDLFEDAHTELNAKEVANIITTELMGLEDTREKREASKLTSIHLKDLADAIQTGKVSRNSSKNALHEILKTGKSVSQIISELDLGNVSDETELLKIIDTVISQESQAVEQAKSNPQTINFLVGKVMQATKGKADPTLTLNLLKKQIGI